MKAVLDTNVLISGLLWRGAPNQVLKKVEAGRLTLCSSEPLAEELRGVLKRKKFADKLLKRDVSADQLLEFFEDYARFYPDIAIGRVVAEDPADDKVLACAVSAGADWIITGDAHLLRLGAYRAVEILTPRQALRELGS